MSKVASLVEFKNRRRGITAQNSGSSFEQLFYKVCKQHSVAITRFPDGCKQIAAHKIIRIKTPFDWVISFNNRTALLDTKCSAEHSFAHSKIVPHQVSEMVDHEMVGGAIAGYIIWFRKPDQVFYVPSKQLLERSKVSGSIQATDKNILLLGSGFDFNIRLIFKNDP